mgnify:CR=1 FL=1
MEKSIFICLPGDPVGKGRTKTRVIKSKASGKAFAMHYTPEKTRTYESNCKFEASLSMRGQPPLIGPVELKLQIFMAIPISYSKKKREACLLGKVVPTKKPDFDNVLKAVCDAFNGTVFVDDTQIVDSVITKRFSAEPCIIAIVTPLDLECS